MIYFRERFCGILNMGIPHSGGICCPKRDVCDSNNSSKEELVNYKIL